ncbi:uncharacterized protein V6R79_018561 [Siganus canaliculatus]
MEETLQQEKQELESGNPTEDQGGFRRRLRDRDLLRKRKAEAEEKETNQEESQRKRPRAQSRSSAKKRGRPRKSEATAEISVIPEQAAAFQEAPAVVVVSEPAEATPDQTSGSALPVESQPATVPAVPAGPAAPAVPAAPTLGLVFGTLERPIFSPSLISQPPLKPAPAFFSPPVPAPAPTKDPDSAPIPIQDLDPEPSPAPPPDIVSVPVLSQDPVPSEAAAPPAVPQESEGPEALNQVLIEDLGPDEEEDIPPSQCKSADEDMSETPSNGVPEPNKVFSVPTLSSQPRQQEYLPGNSF